MDSLSSLIFCLGIICSLAVICWWQERVQFWQMRFRMGDSVSQVDKIYMPLPACVLSALPLCCIHSMTPSKYVGPLREMGCLCLKHCHRLYASYVWSVRLQISINPDRVLFWYLDHFACQVSGHQNCYSGDWTWHQTTGEAHKIRILAAKNKKWKYEENIASITLEWG